MSWKPPAVAASRPGRFLAGAIPTLLVAAIAAGALLLEARAPELYYLTIQEDHWAEWATAWAFLLAAPCFLVAARRQHVERARLPWFLGGLALFSLLVAMEEISWGQRLFSYQPPAYFLADNFQQELNFHNVLATPLRKLTLEVLIVGYGVLLPVARLLPPTCGWIERVGIQSPPLSLVPCFVLTFLFYRWYPLEYTGEWVELMFGLGLLLAGVLAAWRGRVVELVTTPAAAVLVAALGVASVPVTASIASGADGRGEWAQREIMALSADFAHERVRTRCGVHKRVYTFVNEHGQAYPREGRFAGLVELGLDEKRARFFLDPWNMPYWIRHKCIAGREAVFVYSFGPNRRRDSTQWQIRDDDVGAPIATGGS